MTSTVTTGHNLYLYKTIFSKSLLFRIRKTQSMDDSRKVLQVTNITHSATDADLADLFSVAGDVARTSIIQSGFPYYAFVEYYNPHDARRALNLNGKFFGPSKITVEFATQPFPQQPLLGAAPGMGVNIDPGFRRPNHENLSLIHI